MNVLFINEIRSFVNIIKEDSYRILNRFIVWGDS